MLPHFWRISLIRMSEIKSTITRKDGRPLCLTCGHPINTLDDTCEFCWAQSMRDMDYTNFDEVFGIAVKELDQEGFFLIEQIKGIVKSPFQPSDQIAQIKTAIDKWEKHKSNENNSED